MSSRKRSREEIDTERQEALGDWPFKQSSKEVRGDFDVVLLAVKKNGWNLQHASKDLQNNQEVVLAAVRQAGGSLKYASVALRANHDIVMTAVLQNGYSFRYASSDLRTNRDIALAAIRNDPEALEFASKDLKADKDLVLTAVGRQSGWYNVFQFAADNLRDDHDFLARAMSSAQGAVRRRVGATVLGYASNGIKRDLRDTAQKFSTLLQAQVFLHGKLQSYAAFMEFLCCVKSKSAAAAGSPVTKVNLDKITSEKLHRHIAEYVGVPLGQELEPVRLVKRVMPILEAYFRGRNTNNSGNLGWFSRL